MSAAAPALSKLKLEPQGANEACSVTSVDALAEQRVPAQEWTAALEPQPGSIALWPDLSAWLEPDLAEEGLDLHCLPLPIGNLGRLEGRVRVSVASAESLERMRGRPFHVEVDVEEEPE